MLSPRCLWKNSLLLLAVSVNRRDAAIAFVQTGLLSQSQPSAAASTALLSNARTGVDVATAPLSELIQLDCESADKKNCYKLVSPAEDVLPLEEGQRLICIGDVHGDFDALEEFLTIADVYDPSLPPSQQWVGGDTIVVQCGDVLDRGSEELLCFNLLTRLSQQAADNGGHLIILWGNHEALNAGGMFHYTTGEEEYESLLGKTIDEQLNTEKWRMQYAGT